MARQAVGEDPNSMSEQWEKVVGPIADASGREMRLIPNEPDKGHMRVQVFTDQWWDIGFVDLGTTMHYFCHPKDGPIDINGDNDPPHDVSPEQALQFLLEELKDLSPQITSEDGP